MLLRSELKSMLLLNRVNSGTILIRTILRSKENIKRKNYFGNEFLFRNKSKV